MDKEMLKLLVGIPPEILSAWEIKHPEKWSIYYIAKNHARYKRLTAGLQIVWFMAIFMIGMLIMIAMGGHRVVQIVTMFTTMILGLTAIVWVEMVTHIDEWNKILQSLETAIKDKTLDLIGYLKQGHGLKHIQQGTHASLVWAAQASIDAEERFSNARTQPAMLEFAVMSAAQDSIARKNVFDKMLSRAVEFGLSDGTRRQYFEEAHRRNLDTSKS